MIGIETRPGFTLLTVGTGNLRACPLLSPSLSPARLLPSSAVLKICCTRGRLRYARTDFPNVNRPMISLRASGGYVAVVPCKRSAGWSRGGNGGTTCIPTSGPGLTFSGGEESGAATSRAPNVETRLCPRRSEEDW